MVNKERVIHISIIFLVILLYFYPYLNIRTFPARGDDPNIKGVHTTDLTAILGIYPWEARKVIYEYGQFPFWSPWRFGGTPIFAKPQAVFFYVNLPLLLFAPTIYAAIKWSILLHFIIAGISMYSLMHYLSRNNLASFVSAFVYTFNGYIVSRLNWGQTNIIYPYAWLPLILLFTFFAIEKKEWVFNSILVGVLFSFLLFGGGAQLLSYFAIVYVYFLIIYFLTHFSKHNLFELSIKYARMGIIIGLVFFGLIAVFILPNSDLMEISVRSGGYSYEQSVGGRLRIIPFFKGLMNPHIFKIPFSDWNSSGLGLVPLLFVILSLFLFRKKKGLLFLLLTVATISIFQGSYLYRIFWELIPQFRQVKGIFKGHAIIFLMLSILAGYGFLYFINKTERFKYKNIIRYSAVALIFINLTFFNNVLTAQTNIDYELSRNGALQHIAKDNDLFRFRIFETNGIDWGTDHYNVPLGLHDVYGTENVWITDYLPIYLSQANAYPAKLYGILNTKYVTSKSPLNITGYNLIAEFDGCGYYPNGMEICQPRKSDGNYLYQNAKVLPRAYAVNRSILIAGDKDSVLQAGYYIITNPNYSPVNTVVIMEDGKIQDHDPSFLENINLIILTQNSVDSGSLYPLQTYPGILLPDIRKGGASFDGEKLHQLLLNFSNFNYNQVYELKVAKYTPNEIIVETDGIKGFLVLSEQFSYYKNWHAFDENGIEKTIYHANGVISAVPLQGEKKITFRYIDNSFKKGAIISSITLLAIIIYMSYSIYKGKND